MTIIDEKVPEEQPNKEGNDRNIPYSPSYCPICTPIAKVCKERQTVSDGDEEEENSTPIPPALIHPPEQPETSYKQRYFDSKLNSQPPKMTLRIKRQELVYLAQQELNKAIKDIPQQNIIDEVD